MRKYLGVDADRTLRWMELAKGCPTCMSLSKTYLATTISRPIVWGDIQQHLETVHASEELCITCFIWIEDEEFEDHLRKVHKVAWKLSQST